MLDFNKNSDIEKTTYIYYIYYTTFIQSKIALCILAIIINILNHHNKQTRIPSSSIKSKKSLKKKCGGWGEKVGGIFQIPTVSIWDRLFKMSL